MQAGEIGVTIEVFPTQPPTPGFLTGATCILVARSPIEILNSLALIVSSDGSYAYRLTTADDFPIAGDYNIQFVVTYPSGQELKSAIQTLNIGYSLI